MSNLLITNQSVDQYVPIQSALKDTKQHDSTQNNTWVNPRI